MRGHRLALYAAAVLAAGATAGPAHGSAFTTDWSATVALTEDQSVFEGPVPRASCKGQPERETGLQGQVPLADRQSGRNKLGYRCNMELVGQYQGQGTTWVSQSYEHCAYHGQAFPSSLQAAHPGVYVVDVRDPTRPKFVRSLTSPAFLGNTWESLKVNTARGLLAGVFVGTGDGAAFFDVYDIKTDCLHPKLLSSVSESDLSLPANTLGHEGNWAPDGKTYWSSSVVGGMLTAIDVSDPRVPKTAFVGQAGTLNHGFGLSVDGRRLYLANVSPEGLDILDVSQVQDRTPAPQIRSVGAVTWDDGATGQHTIPVTWGGRPYVVFVDEGGAGAARIIDIADEAHPRVVSKLKLQIHMPQFAGARAADTADNGPFGYEGHYCEVDRQTDPTALACGYFQSGIRLFDVRDPMAPREVAYFNPPAQVGKNDQLPGSEHAEEDAELSADYCSSPPRFVGDDQLWVTCQDNGFMVLRYTNGRWPLTGEAPPVRSTCVSRRTVTIHLRRGLRSVAVFVGGRRVRVVRRAARISLRGVGRRTVVVRIVSRTRAGRRLVQVRRYRTCASA